VINYPDRFAISTFDSYFESALSIFYIMQCTWWCCRISTCV